MCIDDGPPFSLFRQCHGSPLNSWLNLTTGALMINSLINLRLKCRSHNPSVCSETSGRDMTWLLDNLEFVNAVPGHITVRVMWMYGRPGAQR